MFLLFIKTPFFLILTSMLAAIVLVSILAWSALMPLNEKRGFDRKIIAQEMQLLSVSDKPADVFDFAGITAHHIYFKTKDPSKIYETGMQLQNGKYLDINIPNDKGIASMFNCMVDSPYTYIAAPNARLLVKAKPGDSPIIYKLPESIFVRAVLLSDNSIAVRMFDQLDLVFAKQNLNTGELKKENNISEKKKDGGISTDGALYYDKKTGFLVGMQTYGTEITVLDTNLNLIRRIKTINPDNSFDMKVGKVSADNSMTSLSPKQAINISGCVSNGYLYNNSLMKADNETLSFLENNSIIDIYNLKTGESNGSFYLPAYKGEKARKLKVIDSFLLVLYKKYMAVYKLPFLINGEIK